MAVPELNFLTGRAREALLFLRAAARGGLTPAEAYNLVKQFDVSFQKQRMLDVYAILQNRIDPERVARLVGENVPIPVELHTPSTTDINANYQYVVGAYNEFGLDIGFVTISSAVPLSAATIRREGGILFATQAELYLEDASEEVAAVSIVEANISGKVP